MADAESRQRDGVRRKAFRVAMTNYGAHGAECILRAAESKDWAAVTALAARRPDAAREKNPVGGQLSVEVSVKDTGIRTKVGSAANRMRHACRSRSR